VAAAAPSSCSPFLTLEQLVRARASTAAPPASAPLALHQYATCVREEMVAEAVAPRPPLAAMHEPADANAILLPQPTVAEGATMAAQLHPHPAQQLWKLKWTEMAVNQIPRSLSGRRHGRHTTRQPNR